MKKLLLSMAAAARAFTAGAVEPITVDFSQAEAFDDPGATATTQTIGGVSFSCMGSYVSAGYNGGANYLMIKGKTTAGAYVEASLPFECAKVDLITTSGCSTNAKSVVNVYFGSTAVAKNLKVNVHEETFTVSGTPANKVKIESGTTGYNQQFAKIVFYPVTSDPSLSADVKSVSFAVAKGGQQTQTVKVVAANITGNISVTSDNAAFAAAKASYTVAEAAEGIEIVFTGNEAGEKSGNVTFAAGSTTASIEVAGYTAANAGTETNPLTVEDIIGMNSVNTDEFFVTGTINDLTAANAKDGVLTTVASADKNAATNIVLKNGENIIGVALPTANDIRATLNIVDNPTNVGKTIVIKGKPRSYFSAPGLDCTEYVSGLAGVEDVAVEAVEGEVEYFNLQGVRVAEPAAGLYIRRQGNTVTKVLVK